MAHKVAIPAVALRGVAQAALNKADVEEKVGRDANARNLRRSAKKAIDAADGNSSNFVSVPARPVASICAFGHDSEYHDSVRVMLEHQNWW